MHGVFFSFFKSGEGVERGGAQTIIRDNTTSRVMNRSQDNVIEDDEESWYVKSFQSRATPQLIAPSVPCVSKNLTSLTKTSDLVRAATK